MTDMILAGQFVASKVGVNGLTVTIDIEAVEIATGTRSAHTTGASATAVTRRGLYTYRLTGATPATHVYIGTFITADTSVDQKEVAAVAMVVPDELVSSRATTIALALVQADTDNIQTRLPAALVGGRMDSDAGSIGGGFSVTGLRRLSSDFIVGEITGVPTTTQFNVTGGSWAARPKSAFLNRLIAFNSGGVTGHIRRITDYDPGAALMTIYPALPSAPAAGVDAFTIYPIRVGVDIEAVSESPTAADALEANIANLDAPISSVQVVVSDIKSATYDLAIFGNVTELGQTTTFDTDLGGTYTDDRLKNRILLFTGGPNAGAVRRIADYADGTITVDPPLFAATSGVESIVVLALTDQVDVESGGGATAQEVWEYDEGERALSAAGNLAIWNVLTTAAFAIGSMGRFILTQLGFITADTTIQVGTPVNAGLLTITKAVTLETGALNVTVPANWTKCYVTGKASKNSPDTAALFQIVESYPPAGGDGLLVLNGAEAMDPAQGSATVDEDNNQVAFTLTDNVTALMAKQNGYWDIKFLVGDGSSTRPVAGLVEVVLPVTLTI